MGSSVITADLPVVLDGNYTVRCPARSDDTLHTIARQVRNWGRWGPDDELGTLNYVTPDTIAAACRLATTGKVFALGIPLQREGPQSGTRQRFNPIHAMFRDGGDAPKTPAEGVAMQGYGGSDHRDGLPPPCGTPRG